MKKKLLSIALVVILLLSLSLALIGCSTKDAEIQTHSVGNGTDLTIGVISDTQLPSNGIKDKYYYNYVDALKTLKDKGVETIMFVGDMTDQNTKKASLLAKEAWVEVFGSIEAGPIKNYIMGNHDFWLPNFFDCWEIPSKGKMEKRFKVATGEEANTHKVINGYHFINASPANGDMEKGYDKQISWIKKQLDLAIAESPDKPIFLNTHVSPNNTVYGSEDGGSASLAKLLKSYPQVISVGGHSHASLLDEMSIWQGEYTAIQTQSLSYTSNPGENIYENYHTNSNQPMAMVITLTGSTIKIDRISAHTGEKLRDSWTLNMPLKDNLNKYSASYRKSRAGLPNFNNKSVSTTFYNGKYYIEFTPAAPGIGANIRSYKVQYVNTDTNENLYWQINGAKQDYLMYMGDFDQEPDSNTAILEITREIPPGNYKIEITAIDCFGNESENPLTHYYTVNKK